MPRSNASRRQVEEDGEGYPVEAILAYDRARKCAKVRWQGGVQKHGRRGCSQWVKVSDVGAYWREWVDRRYLCGTEPALASDTYENRNPILETLLGETVGGNALTLDTSCLLTTRMLLRKGFKVHIPNPVEVTPLTRAVRRLSLPQRRKVKVYGYSLHHFLQDYTGRPFDVVYADFCCSWTGNQMCRPREDIHLLLDRGLLQRGALLAVTASYRSSQTCLCKGHQGDWVMEEVTRIAQTSNLCLEPLNPFVYYGKRVFMVVFRRL